MSNIPRKIPNNVKYCIVAPFVMSALYFIAIAPLEYGYYTFIRWVSLIVLSILFTISLLVPLESKESVFNFPVIASAILMVIFNPINPLYFSKQVWSVIDALAGVVMIAVGIYVIIVRASTKN